MNDYFDWAYSVHYFSAGAKHQSSRRRSGPTNERANDVSQELLSSASRAEQAGELDVLDPPGPQWAAHQSLDTDRPQASNPYSLSHSVTRSMRCASPGPTEITSTRS